jgi:hypothetical protein
MSSFHAGVTMGFNVSSAADGTGGTVEEGCAAEAEVGGG